MKKSIVILLILLCSFSIYSKELSNSSTNLLSEVKNLTNYDNITDQGISYVLDNYKQYVNNIKKGNGVIIGHNDIFSLENNEYESLVDDVIATTDFNNEEFTIKGDEKVYVIKKDGNTFTFHFPLNCNLTINIDDLINEDNKKYRSLIEDLVENTNFCNEDYIVVEDGNIFILEKDDHIFEFNFPLAADKTKIVKTATEETEVNKFKRMDKQFIIGASPYLFKITDFFKSPIKARTTKYGAGLTLGSRYNITKTFSAGMNLEYRQFIENAFLPSNITHQIPVSLYVGYFNRLNDRVELFTTFGAGINVGLLDRFFSFRGLLTQFDFGFNYYLTESFAINIKSSFNTSYEAYNKEPILNSFTYIINPLQICMTLGVR